MTSCLRTLCHKQQNNLTNEFIEEWTFDHFCLLAATDCFLKWKKYKKKNKINITEKTIIKYYFSNFDIVFQTSVHLAKDKFMQQSSIMEIYGALQVQRDRHFYASFDE